MPKFHQAGEDLHRQHEIRLELLVGHVEHVVDLLDLRSAVTYAFLEARVQAAQFLVLPTGEFRQLAIADLEVAPRQGLAHDEQDVVVVPGLGDVAMDFSAVDRGNGRADVGVSGQQDADRMGVQAPDLFQELGTVHAGHTHVRDDEVDRVVCDELEGRRTAFGRENPVSLRAEQAT